MAPDHSIPRYRSWYGQLLRLYPKPYRERFSEGMQQTFADLCRERSNTQKGLFGFILWMFIETSVQIIKQNLRFHFMYTKGIFRVALVTALILLIPLIAMQFTSEVSWSAGDFVFMGGLLFGTGLAWELISKKSGKPAYRIAVALAVLASFLLIWVNAAVGIIGEDNPANLLYFAVVAIAFFGALASKFEARKSSYVMFVAAAAQAIVPVIALVFWNSDFSPGVMHVFALNGFFVMLWIASGLLLQRAQTQ